MLQKSQIEVWYHKNSSRDISHYIVSYNIVERLKWFHIHTNYASGIWSTDQLAKASICTRASHEWVSAHLLLDPLLRTKLIKQKTVVSWQWSRSWWCWHVLVHPRRYWTGVRCIIAIYFSRYSTSLTKSSFSRSHVLYRKRSSSQGMPQLRFCCDPIVIVVVVISCNLFLL